ncbi:hypothetical protein RJT34_27521 [Clitoria ternatea]|uniref:Aminotransferase-like plant mobile domain-containing protein n=1 Tax=Clitoria ternatea TaxID=43366 RepID=A0AAN9F8A1_CLITE
MEYPAGDKSGSSGAFLGGATCTAVGDAVSNPYGARWFTGDTNTTARGDLDHYRQVFDMMKRDEIIWEPYPDDTLGTLCEICLRGRDAWRATVPLICFQIVEWHQPDRVMRQFGMQQHIPSAPRQPDNIHGITLRGKTDENWSATYVPLIQLWSCRSENVCTTDPQIGILSASSEYMRWYTSHTRRWITRKYAIKGRTTDVLEVIQYLSSPEGRSNTISLTDLLDSIRHEAENILFFMKEEDRLIVARTNAPVLTQEPTPVEVEINMPKKRVECQGIARGRAREEAQQYIIPPLPPRQEGSYRVPSQEPASSLMLTYQYHPS